MGTVQSILIAAFLFTTLGAADTLATADIAGHFHRVADKSNATPDACYPRISFAIKLAETLGQIKQVSGSETRGNLMELYANLNSGTWTLVLVLPRGLVCEIGNGTSFLIEPQPQRI